MFNGVKVFSATMLADREVLGEKVTAWLAASPGIDLVDLVLTQSSDNKFHCVAITVFYKNRSATTHPGTGRRLKFREQP